MEIKKQILGKWSSVMDTYEFFDENDSKIHPDQISSDINYKIEIDETNIKAIQPGELPVISNYEIQQDVLDYYLVVFVGTETQIHEIKLSGNNLTMISEVNGMKYQKDGVWHTAPKSIYTIEFSRG
jgi:hypothetical protein